jgi:hypothetical protein
MEVDTEFDGTSYEPQLISYPNFRKSSLQHGNYFHFVEIRDWRHNRIFV